MQNPKSLKVNTRLASQLSKMKKSLLQDTFTPENVLFDKQLELFYMEGEYFAITCSRRAGKSYFIAFLLIHTCLADPEMCSLYIAHTKADAINIIWNPLTKMLRDYSIPHKLDNKNHMIHFPNRSFIMIGGCKDKSEIDNLRGISPSPVLVAIDEAGHFKPYLRVLFQETIRPMLSDYCGKTYFIGTPNPTCSGTFYDAYTQQVGFKDFKSFHWTLYDNPKIPSIVSGKQTHDSLMAKLIEGTGRTLEDPVIQREYFGRWLKTDDEYCYAYNDTRNGVDEIPLDFLDNACFVLAVDTGFVDNCAYTVLAYNPHSPITYIVESYKRAFETVTEIIDEVNMLNKRYGLTKISFDPAAGGKNISAELYLRYNIRAEASPKDHKEFNANLMNDQLRLGKLLVHREGCSDLIQEWEFLVWVIKADGTKKVGTMKGDVKFDHCSDSCLYGWRDLTNYRNKAAPIVPKEGTAEYLVYEEEELLKKLKKDAVRSARADDMRFMSQFKKGRRR